MDMSVYLTADILTATGLVKHGFSTRHGGLMGEVTSNFNLGFKNADPTAVCKMRNLFLNALI